MSILKPFLKCHGSLTINKGRIVNTMYVIRITDFDSHKSIADLPAPGGRVDHVSIDFNADNPGGEEPHYHMWHVPKAKESLVTSER